MRMGLASAADYWISREQVMKTRLCRQVTAIGHSLQALLCNELPAEGCSKASLLGGVLSSVCQRDEGWRSARNLAWQGKLALGERVRQPRE